MYKPIIAPIITLIIGLAIAYWAFYLEREFVDVRYTLSEIIPTKYVEHTTADPIQILVVKNNGNVRAEDVQVKINGTIENFNIRKSSASDQVLEHHYPNYFESVYPFLPPGAEYSYIFKTTAAGISSSNIEVFHSRGMASEALTVETNSAKSAVTSIIGFTIICIYLILATMQGRILAVHFFKQSREYSGIIEFLKKKKPLYVTGNEWQKIRIDFIDSDIRNRELQIYSISESEFYRTLNREKPNYITIEEWQALTGHLEKKLEDSINYKLHTSSPYSAHEELLLLSRPIQFSEYKWEALRESINKYIILNKQLQNSSYSSLALIEKELKSDQPVGIIESYWKDYKNKLEDRFYNITMENLNLRYGANEYLKEVDLKLLKETTREKLQEHAYNLDLSKFAPISSLYAANKFMSEEAPSWMREEDVARFKEIAEKYIEIDQLETKYKYLTIYINEILNKVPLESIPHESISPSEWDKIKKIESETSSIAREVQSDKIELAKERSNLNILKDKILNQLNILNEIISNPSSIDRFEPYEIDFSKGNYENIKIFAAHLKNT